MSNTQTEYPVVVDVDNDGQAEVLATRAGPEGKALVRAMGAMGSTWMPARRIWNQQAYHVTNVHEDGRIPKQQAPHWERLNTYRANAHVQGGRICVPPP